MKTCAIIGSDNSCGNINDASAKTVLKRLVDDFHIGCFAVGMTYVAERRIGAVLSGSGFDRDKIKFWAVLSSENEAEHWNEQERNSFYHIMENCHKEIILNPISEENKVFCRNLIMMNNADLLLLLDDDESLNFWAKKSGVPFLTYHLKAETLIPDLFFIKNEKPLDSCNYK